MARIIGADEILEPQRDMNINIGDGWIARLFDLGREIFQVVCGTGVQHYHLAGHCWHAQYVDRPYKPVSIGLGNLQTPRPGKTVSLLVIGVGQQEISGTDVQFFRDVKNFIPTNSSVDKQCTRFQDYPQS